MRLRDQVAIVTGGGRGIGAAVALALSREGGTVVAASRTTAELADVVGRITSTGGSAMAVTADVSMPGDVRRLVDTVVAAHGRIDILVNAAGVYGPIGYTWEAAADEWAAAMSVNLLGTFYACHAVLPHMVSRRRGKIINFSGGGATAPLPRFSAYGASKAGVVRLTETLAEELKEFNVQVNAIAPGAVDTRLQESVLAAGARAGDVGARMRKMRETGEGGVPAELAAELAVFLSSEPASALTGRLIAAPHDGWQSWDAKRIDDLMKLPWLTLRRMDPFTLRPLCETLE